MTKVEALKMIDQHKNKLIDPVEALHWTWLRVIINQLTEDEWDELLKRATPVLSS